MSPRSAQARRERILVRGPNWLGDVVMSTPGLRALRVRRPDAEIVVQLPAPLVPLLGGATFCDAVWPVARRAEGLAALRRDARQVAEAGFDLGIVIPESISSALAMRWGRVGQSVGFARDPLRRWLLDRVAPAPAAWGRRRLVSRERFVLQLIEAAVPAAASSGAASAAAVAADAQPDTRLELSVTPAEEARLAAALELQGTSVAALLADPPIVLAPGAGFGEAKCWPSESFAALADRLLAGDRSVLLLGAPGESERIAAVRRSMRGAAVVLDGGLDLGALKALLRSARALVANDAGARHVAAAFGVPSVVFFGPTAVAKTADNLAAIEVLESEHDCRPCYRRRCPIDHRCLRSIDVEQAEAATRRALVRGRAPRDLKAAGEGAR